MPRKTVPLKTRVAARLVGVKITQLTEHSLIIRFGMPWSADNVAKIHKKLAAEFAVVKEGISLEYAGGKTVLARIDPESLSKNLL